MADDLLTFDRRPLPAPPPGEDLGRHSRSLQPLANRRNKAPAALGDRGFMMGSTRRLGSDDVWLPR